MERELQTEDGEKKVCRLLAFELLEQERRRTSCKSDEKKKGREGGRERGKVFSSHVATCSPKYGWKMGVALCLFVYSLSLLTSTVEGKKRNERILIQATMIIKKSCEAASVYFSPRLWEGCHGNGVCRRIKPG